jgi:hypothetical protein
MQEVQVSSTIAANMIILEAQTKTGGACEVHVTVVETGRSLEVPPESHTDDSTQCPITCQRCICLESINEKNKISHATGQGAQK